MVSEQSILEMTKELLADFNKILGDLKSVQSEICSLKKKFQDVKEMLKEQEELEDYEDDKEGMGSQPNPDPETNPNPKSDQNRNSGLNLKLNLISSGDLDWKLKPPPLLPSPSPITPPLPMLCSPALPTTCFLQPSKGTKPRAIWRIKSRKEKEETSSKPNSIVSTGPRSSQMNTIWPNPVPNYKLSTDFASLTALMAYWRDWLGDDHGKQPPPPPPPWRLLLLLFLPPYSLPPSMSSQPPPLLALNHEKFIKILEWKLNFLDCGRASYIEPKIKVHSNSVIGFINPKTMNLVGTIEGLSVVILMDARITCSFILEKLVVTQWGEVLLLRYGNYLEFAPMFLRVVFVCPFAGDLVRGMVTTGVGFDSDDMEVADSLKKEAPIIVEGLFVRSIMVTEVSWPTTKETANEVVIQDVREIVMLALLIPVLEGKGSPLAKQHWVKDFTNWYKR